VRIEVAARIRIALARVLRRELDFSSIDCALVAGPDCVKRFLVEQFFENDVAF